MEEAKFIEDSFRVRHCFKFQKSENSNSCKCGKRESLHKDGDKNSTRTEACDTYGIIQFEGYKEFSSNLKSKFIKFDCVGDPSIAEKAYDLIEKTWKFPTPGLIISINGGYKRMNATIIQKNRFKDKLIDLMRNERTWIIGGASDRGIHQLVSEAVHDYHQQNDENKNQVKLIGICTFGVIHQKECLVKGNVRYFNIKQNIKRQITLSPHCDCLLFCDDGTEKEYDKEIEFRLQLEKYIHEKKNAFAIQILFEGGRRALELAYRSLKQSVPVTVIKNSGRAANILLEIKYFKDENLKKNISDLLEKYETALEFKDNREKYANYLEEIYIEHREKIFVHDMTDHNINLDKKIFEAFISSIDHKNLDRLLGLTLQFNSHDLAEKLVFQNPDFDSLDEKCLKEHFQEALKNNKHQFVRLFLENNFSVETYLDKNVLEMLYKNSFTSNKCRCTDLFKDLQCNVKDISKIHNSSCEEILKIVKKIIRKLTKRMFKLNKLNKILVTEKINSSVTSKSNDEEIEMKVQLIENEGGKKIVNDNLPLDHQDLFFWALLSDYTETAAVLWKAGKLHISSGLIAVIILNKLNKCALKRGDNELSERLLLGSKTFLKIITETVNEAFKDNQMKTYMILFRKIEIWDNLSCLEIAIRGKLREFLSLSSCKAYTNETWMGDFSSITPMWRILLNIPFSIVLFRPLMKPYFSDKKPVRELKKMYKIKQQEKNTTDTNTTEKKNKVFSYLNSLKKFYKMPLVKFIIYFVSYIIFILAFACLNLVEMKPINKYKSLWNISPVEIFVYFYILMIVVEEIHQIKDQKPKKILHKLKVYKSSLWNVLDISLIGLFILSTILRIALPEEQFVIIRCSFSITLSLFCLRTMQFYCISRYIGPKVIIVGKMMVDIGFFLSIFVLFLLSYGLLVQSVLYEHTEFSLSLIKDVLYSPYFQTYGELMLENFNLPSCNSTTCIVKYSTVIFGFAVFLLFTNILLINLLIAMFGQTYHQVQAELEKCVAFIQIQLVEEFYQKPLLPPPLNIFYYFMYYTYLNRRESCDKSDFFLSQKLKDEYDKNIDHYEKVRVHLSFLKLEREKTMKSNITSDINNNEIRKENI